MAWVYLDDQFPDHPKVAAAGGDAGWLFICGLAYVKRYSTEGVIPKAQVPRLSDRKAPTRLARRLVEVGLWEDDGDNYRIHDYHEWNRSGENRKAAAKKAAQARWRNNKADANGNAKRIADASETHTESQSDRTAEPDASACPIPQPLTEEPTSSDSLTSPADTPDDDDGSSSDQGGDDLERPDLDARVGAAIAVLASRDLDARQAAVHLPPVGDAVSWQNGAYDRREKRHGDELRQLAEEHPDATPEELADLIDTPGPRTETTPAGDRVDHRYDAQQQAMLRAAEEGVDAHRRALDEVPTDPDPDGSLRAAARAGLPPHLRLVGEA